MRYTKITVAVAAAGAGVICLAPTAAAEETAPEPGTAANSGTLTLAAPTSGTPGARCVTVKFACVTGP